MTGAQPRPRNPSPTNGNLGAQHATATERLGTFHGPQADHSLAQGSPPESHVFGAFGAPSRAVGSSPHLAEAAPARGEGRRGAGAPQRSPSGRTFDYHGQHFTRFAAAPYRWPEGYRYRRYEAGYQLPRTYWVLHDYYVDDYWDYGLAPPPEGSEWIRYGPDLLQVDLATGEISQALYGAFDDPSAN